MDQRLRAVLTELLSHEEPTTLDSMACRVKVSRRTLQEDLDRLEGYLMEYPGAVLRRQPRRGIWLEAPAPVRMALFSTAGGPGSEDMSALSPPERQRRLICLLLAGGDPTTMQSLADRLFFSRATIQKDLEAVARWFAQRGLTLHRRPRQGIELTGSEANWRRAVADHLVEVAADDQILHFLREMGGSVPGSRLDVGSVTDLLRLFPSLNLRVLEEAVRSAESHMGFRFSDEAYAGLVVHLAVAVERIARGKEIQMPPQQLMEFSALPEYTVAGRLAAVLQTELGVAFPPEEVGYIALHLLGAKVQANLSEPGELLATLPHLEPGVLALARRMAALAERVLEVPLQDDIQLITGLALHLRPTINRLKHGLGLRNPVLEELKRAYPSILGLGWMCAAVLEESVGVAVTEEEVGYLALHLGAAVERARTRRRVLVVCGSGMGTAQLVASRLRAHFPDLEIAGLLPSLAVQDQNLYREGIDMIIATVPVPAQTVPVVRVHPLLPNEDVQKLARFLGGTARTPAPTAGAPAGAADPLRSLRLLLQGRLLTVRCSATSKQGVITELARALSEAGYVAKGFCPAVCKREELTSTAIGKGVAIPHAEAQYTVHTAVAVGALSQPVDWNGEPVQLVFMLALTNQEPDMVVAVTRELYQLIDDDEALNRLRLQQAQGRA